MNSRNRIHSCYDNQDQGLLVSLLVVTSDAIYSKAKEKCRWDKLLAQRCTRKTVEKFPTLLCHWDVALR